MPRYELSEGSSNKFWEIKLSGKSFTTTYGKIGANGQTTIKKFTSDAEAKKEHDKIVAEKTKKGYALAGGKAAKGSTRRRVCPQSHRPAVRATSNSSEGSSNKFWEVSLEGTTVRTRYGKIGAKGQPTIKDFGVEGRRAEGARQARRREDQEGLRRRRRRRCSRRSRRSRRSERGRQQVTRATPSSRRRSSRTRSTATRTRSSPTGCRSKATRAAS